MGPVELRDPDNSFSLQSDAGGDTLAVRFGRSGERVTRVLFYDGGSGRRRVGVFTAHPGDSYALGAGDALWTSTFDPEVAQVQVRRLDVDSATSTVVWSRQYPKPPHRDSRAVFGVPLAANTSGDVVLAVHERSTQTQPDAVRAVRRVVGQGWGPLRVLHQLPDDVAGGSSVPVVAVDHDGRAVLAWAAPAEVADGQDVLVTVWNRGADPVGRQLDRTRARSGFRDLGLQATVDDDGEALVSFVRLRGAGGSSHTVLVGYTGDLTGDPVRTVLLDPSGGPVTVQQALDHGVGLVVDRTDTGLVSRVLEDEPLRVSPPPR